MSGASTPFPVRQREGTFGDEQQQLSHEWKMSKKFMAPLCVKFNRKKISLFVDSFPPQMMFDFGVREETWYFAW